MAVMLIQNMLGQVNKIFLIFQTLNGIQYLLQIVK
ncbi:unnamed protein product [Acanthoscelides obtectus]|uniref:Uncharacterized protein n=1 Tax=Acanthoscelides obtectus TaxID=200917 RepID=A0A9P0LLD6_ACAOB|nr:unnamed protein product [Acanthoscelides obtectus]CAK1649689.1 hypothetical protein AOBTE_LOCUS16358 [Acanthoscelides obtectus]